MSYFNNGFMFSLTSQMIATYNEPILYILIDEMRINVAQLLKEPIGSNRHYLIDEPFENEGTESIKGEVTLIRTNRSILVKGTFTNNMTGICSRCLSPVNYTANLNLEEEFFPTTNISSDSPLPSEAEGFTIDNDNILDLSEPIRQYTLLAIPTKLLCRPDCAGICPSCGHNLNQASCQCPSRTYDQRWSKLVHLGKERKI